VKKDSPDLSLLHHSLCFDHAHLPDQFSWSNSLQIDAVIHHPKHTDARVVSSHLSPSQLEENDNAVHIPETTFIFRTSSAHPSSSPTIGTSPEINLCAPSPELLAGTLACGEPLPSLRS
jgi:hypothetical protein